MNLEQLTFIFTFNIVLLGKGGNLTNKSLEFFFFSFLGVCVSFLVLIYGKSDYLGNHFYFLLFPPFCLNTLFGDHFNIVNIIKQGFSCFFGLFWCVWLCVAKKVKSLSGRKKKYYFFFFFYKVLEQMRTFKMQYKIRSRLPRLVFFLQVSMCF